MGILVLFSLLFFEIKKMRNLFLFSKIDFYLFYVSFRFGLKKKKKTKYFLTFFVKLKKIKEKREKGEKEKQLKNHFNTF